MLQGTGQKDRAVKSHSKLHLFNIVWIFKAIDNGPKGSRLIAKLACF